MIYKNTASQKLACFAYTASTGAAKTGDAAQITAYISKDFAAAAATDDTNPTELDATNMPGWYVFTLTQAETNAEVIILAAKSSTSGVLIEQIQALTQDAAISSRASQASLDTVDGIVDDILVDTGTTLDTLIKDVPTVAEFEARTLVAADYVVVGDTLAAVTTVGSVTGAVGSVTGAVGSVTGAVGSVTAGVTLANDAITAAKFDESTAFPLTSADTGATAVARTGADSDTLETLSDQLDDLPTAAEVNAEVVDVLRTDTIPDSYAADESQPTIAQAILAIQQFLFERSVSSTTVTVKKPDGSTGAMTFTLDDATNPTSITRAS